MPRKRKEPAPKITKLPDTSTVTKWLIVSADLSLTRTGFALATISLKDGEISTEWNFIGSVKPDDSTEPVWARSKAMSLLLKQEIEKTYLDRMGLIISLEAPPPANDWLASINRILHSTLLGWDLHSRFSEIHILSINAASLRSVMGLVARGAKNKVENIAKSYTFIDKMDWPEIDTDSCDAILLTVVARYVAALLLGLPDEVPDRFKTLLCDYSQMVKGKGRNQKIVTKGILWRPAYWAQYKLHTVKLKVKNAALPTKKLQSVDFAI